MAERELRQRYVGSTIGLAWAVIYPLLLVGFYTGIFAFIFRGRLSPAAPPGEYAIYVVTGLLPWVAFSEVSSRATQVMADNRGLVKFAMFPIQILPLTALYAASISHAAGLALVLAFAAWTRHGLGLELLWLVPALVMQLFLLAGVSWLLGALGAVIRDVKELVGIGLTVGMFATPIFYVEADTPPALRPIIEANPMTHVIRLYRLALLDVGRVDAVNLVVVTVAAIVLLLLGFHTFERVRIFLADIL